MRLVNYVEIAPIALAGGWLLWGMIELFVYVVTEASTETTCP